MIRSVSTNSGWIYAHIPQGPYIPSNTSIPAVGQIWYDTGGGGGLKVFDGSSWMSLPSSLDINLSQKAIDILSWAEKKMEEDAKLQELLTRHEGLKELHEKFEVMKRLCLTSKELND
jgi:hypothetical protein